ncbi:MAG: hypothetical protein AABX90_02755 [Nanoarchaeota archaeon]
MIHLQKSTNKNFLLVILVIVVAGVFVLGNFDKLTGQGIFDKIFGKSEVSEKNYNYEEVESPPARSINNPDPAPSPPDIDGCPSRVDCEFQTRELEWKYCYCPTGCRVTGQYGYNCGGFGYGDGTSLCGVIKGYNDKVGFLMDTSNNEERTAARVGVYCEKITGITSTPRRTG